MSFLERRFPLEPFQNRVGIVASFQNRVGIYPYAAVIEYFLAFESHSSYSEIVNLFI